MQLKLICLNKCHIYKLSITALFFLNRTNFASKPVIAENNMKLTNDNTVVVLTSSATTGLLSTDKGKYNGFNSAQNSLEPRIVSGTQNIGVAKYKILKSAGITKLTSGKKASSTDNVKLIKYEAIMPNKIDAKIKEITEKFTTNVTLGIIAHSKKRNVKLTHKMIEFLNIPK